MVCFLFLFIFVFKSSFFRERDNKGCKCFLSRNVRNIFCFVIVGGLPKKSLDVIFLRVVHN